MWCKNLHSTKSWLFRRVYILTQKTLKKQLAKYKEKCSISGNMPYVLHIIGHIYKWVTGTKKQS